MIYPLIRSELVEVVTREGGIAPTNVSGFRIPIRSEFSSNFLCRSLNDVILSIFKSLIYMTEKKDFTCDTENDPLLVDFLLAILMLFVCNSAHKMRGLWTRFIVVQL